MKSSRLIQVILIFLLGLGYLRFNELRAEANPDDFAADALNAHLSLETLNPNLSFLKNRRAQIQFYLASSLPIIPLENMTKEQQDAYVLCSANDNFRKFLRNEKGEAYLSEIFGIYPTRPGDGVTNATKSQTLRVEMYNFGLNLTTIALVNVSDHKVLNVTHHEHTQADIPLTLKKLALQIATNSPELVKELGFKPEEGQALMASTKSSLNKTRCERSRHLCVAPTFVKNDKALWSIVDLTDLKVAGIRWTNVGSTEPALITERKLQDEKMTAAFCEAESQVEKSGWRINYHLTTSDGLEIKDVRFKDQTILKSVKLVDWHVSYSQSDGFGYSDAVGCPFFSQAAVIATEPPKIKDLFDSRGDVSGFSLEQGYFNQGWPAPCNYNYVQRYEFYSDGKFRVSAASIGRGCGNDGTYSPVFRIAFSDTKSFSEYSENTWRPWAKEQWEHQGPATDYSKEGYQYRIELISRSYYLEPSRGQFSDGGRGDNAYTYVTSAKNHEGEENLVTIGPCCNIDYHQGPEKFIEPDAEPLGTKDFVIWYVPRLKNDDRKGHEYCWAENVLLDGVYQTKTYPCFAGPLFVPGL